MADSKPQNSKPSDKFQISAPAPGSIPPQTFTPGGTMRPSRPPQPLRRGYVAPRYVRTGYVDFTL